MINLCSNSVNGRLLSELVYPGLNSRFDVENWRHQGHGLPQFDCSNRIINKPEKSVVVIVLTAVAACTKPDNLGY